MTLPRVFVTRVIPEAGLTLLRAECRVVVWPEPRPPSVAELAHEAHGAAGLLTMLTDRVDDALLDAAGSDLRVVSNLAVGVDNIDLPAVTRRRLPVGNTPGVLTDSTADFAFALLLAAARRLAEGDRYTRAGQWTTWDPMLLLGQDVAGATLGLVGFGRIGQAVARRAQGFGMNLLYASRSESNAAAGLGARRVDLETLLAEADFVSLHTPLTAETRGLIDARALAAMKPTAILINTARGPVIDHSALHDALVAGRLAGAALDVTDPEPIPPDSPLLTLPNVIIAPHIASASITTRDRMATMAAENVLAGLRGQRLPNCANPEVYDNAPV